MPTDTANLMEKIYDLFSGIYASTANNKAFLVFETLGIPISEGMFKLDPSDPAFCQPLAVASPRSRTRHRRFGAVPSYGA